MEGGREGGRERKKRRSGVGQYAGEAKRRWLRGVTNTTDVYDMVDMITTKQSESNKDIQTSASTS